MNRNFAKLDEQNRIIYAPDAVIRVDHHHEEWIDPRTGEKHEKDWDTERRELHPDADDYAHAKDGPWVTLVSEKPEKVGVTYASTEYGDLVDGVIRRRYTEHPIVAPVPVYSVEEVIYGLITRGKLQPVKAVLGDLYDLITMRDTVSADNEIIVAEFPKVKAALIGEGILTEDEIAEVLKEAEVEE